jgi:hypothetical protein
MDAEQSLDGQWLIGAALKEVTSLRQSTRLSETADERGKRKKKETLEHSSPPRPSAFPSHDVMRNDVRDAHWMRQVRSRFHTLPSRVASTRTQVDDAAKDAGRREGGRVEGTGAGVGKTGRNDPRPSSAAVIVARNQASRRVVVDRRRANPAPVC